MAAAGSSDKGGFELDGDIAGDEGKGEGEGDGEATTAGLDGSQLNPGLTIKLTVSPSLTGYSFRSLLSARAFPFKRRRCASGGGAEGWEAR